MSIGSETAKSGYKTEVLFANLINNNEQFNCAIKKFLNVNEDVELSAEVLTGVQKGDVELSLNNGQAFQVSVKKSIADFSQLDRRWLSSLKSALNVPDNITNEIQEGLDSMRLKTGEKRLILTKYESDIIKYFQNNINIFMDEMFTRQNPIVSLFVVYDSNLKTWYILNMKDVLTFTSNQTVSVSNKGVLKFGDYITMQRKGGDGNVTRVPKTDPTHPSNQLQVKIKPLKIVENLDPMKIYPIA